MQAFMEDLLVRSIPALLPGFLLVAFLVHIGVFPVGGDAKSKPSKGGKKQKSGKSESKAEEHVEEE